MHRGYALVAIDDLGTAVRADTAFYQGCTDVERLIHHYLARSRWVNDRVRQAAVAVYEAGTVIPIGPGEMVDATVTRCVQGCASKFGAGGGRKAR